MTAQIPDSLNTARLHMELLRLDHAAILPKLWNNWEVLRYTYTQLQPDEEACRREIERILTFKASNVVLGPYLLFENAELAGMAGIRSMQNGTWSLYYQFHPDFWGKGMATEAATGLLDYAFREMEIEEVEAECLARNPASGKVLQKLGFELFKVLENGDCGHFKGERMEYWRISKESFLAR